VRPARDPAYLEFVRGQPCAVCLQPGPCEAHHIPRLGHGAMGMKADDYRTAPLCSPCHAKAHTKGRRWLMEQGAEATMVDCLVAWLKASSAARGQL
jgi:hypothetical protein